MIKKFFSWPAIPAIKFSRKDIIGIEFTANNIRLARVSLTGPRKEVVSLLSRDIGGLPDQEVAKLIADCLKEMKARNLPIFGAIPASLAITKNIEVPSIKPAEIREIVNLQAGRHTPYSREEITVDYINIGPYKNSYSKILLVIVARNIIERQSEILNKAGLRLEGMLFSPEAVAWAASKILKIETKDYPAIVIHADEYTTEFSVVFKNKLIFVRAISIGVQHILGESQKYLAKFIEELKKSQEAYQNEDIEKSPAVAVLTGATPALKDYEAILRDALGLQVKVIPYVNNLALSAQAAQIASSSRRESFLNVIAPLIARSEVKVDLTPEKVRMQKALEQRGRELIKTGIYVVTMFVLFFLVLISRIYFQSAYLKELDQAHGPLTKQTGELEKNFSKISLIREYLRSRGYALEVLAEVYNSTGPSVELNYIKFDTQAGRLSLRGTSSVMATIFSFVDTLSKSAYFSDVKTKYTVKRKDGLRDVADFELSILLKK